MTRRIPVAAGNFGSPAMFFRSTFQLYRNMTITGSSSAVSIWGSDDGLIVNHAGTTVRHGEYPAPSAWYTAPTVAHDTIGSPRHINGLSRDLIWIAHETGVHKWNSGTANYDAVKTFTATDKARVVPFAEDDVWVMCRYELWHWNGSTWTDVIGDLPETPSILRGMRKVGTDLYLLLSPSAANTGKVYKRSGGVWSLVATEGTLDYPQDLWVDADDDIWLIYAGSGAGNVRVKHWDGAAWLSKTIYCYTLYDVATPKDIVGVTPGHVWIGYQRGTSYGSIVEAHLVGGDIYGRESQNTYNAVLSMATVGTEHYGANITEGSWDADARVLLGSNSVKDVKVIHPSQDPMFGLMGSSYTGRRYDGQFVRDGNLCIPGGDISFGTVAGGLNEKAWVDESKGVKPFFNYDYSAQANTVVDIPTDDELRMSLQTFAAGGSNVIVNSAPLWYVPGGVDFVLEMDLDCTVDLDVNEVVYLIIRLYAAYEQESLAPTYRPNTDKYFPERKNFWEGSWHWIYWVGTQNEVYNVLWEQNLSANSGYIRTTSKVGPTKYRVTRSGDSLTQEFWDPAGGVWRGNTFTIGQVSANGKDWNLNTPRNLRFLLYGDGGAANQDAVVTISNLTLTGCNPIAYDRSMKLWRPFEHVQGEAEQLPENPSALALDAKGFSIIDLTEQKMAFGASRLEAQNAYMPYTYIDGSGNDVWEVDRIDYHEGLVGMITRDGRVTYNPSGGGNKDYVSRFMLIDFGASRTRHITPGPDAATDPYPGRSGAAFMERNSYSTPVFWNAAASMLTPELRDHMNQIPWGEFTDPANSLPWRAYDGDPRDVAVFREGTYIYFVCAGEQGLFFTKDRPYYENPTPETENAAHLSTYTVEVIAVSIDKASGNMFWLTAAGAFYYAAKATWQAMGETTPNASYYVNGFTHTATTAFSGTLSRRSQKVLATSGTDCYIAADEGVYKSTAGGSFSLLYGVASSGATHEILPAGTTSVDAIAVDDNYLLALCYNSTTQITNLVIILLSSNTVLSTQNVTNELGGTGKRATSMDTRYL